MVRKLLLLTFLAAPFLAAGCSTSDDDDGLGGSHCNTDAYLTATCAGPTGCSCDTGTTPDDDDPTRVCGDGVTDGTSDNFCCFDSGFTAGSCTPSQGTTDQCAEGTYGFECATGDTDPASQDSSLSACSVPVGDSDTSFYCCTYTADTTGGGGGGTVVIPANCTAEPDVTSTCGTGAVGYACDEGTDPESDDPTRVCSTPSLASGEDDYCCYEGFSTTGGTCTPDDGVTDSCGAGSYGFSCAAGDTDPTSQDPNLTSCSVPADGGDADLYCCSYN